MVTQQYCEEICEFREENPQISQVLLTYLIQEFTHLFQIRPIG